RSAAAVFPLPMGSANIGVDFTIEGRPVAKADEPTAEFRQVSPGYFETAGIPLLSGRDFTPKDDAAAPRVAIINAEFARRHFPGESPLGKRFRPGLARDGDPETRTIVGVVGSVKARGLAQETLAEFYVPYAQLSIADMVVVARVDGDPRALSGDVRSLV